MRSILLAAFSTMLLAGISCSPARSGNRMMTFNPDPQSIRYRSVKHQTRLITAIIIDDDDRQPISSATVELYAGDNMTVPLMTTITGTRGKFSFTVKDGVYTIIINHQRFKEGKIPVSVKGWDIDLNVIRLHQFFD